MHTPIAFHNLMHGKWRTIVSTSGVALAITLVFMQLGFLWVVGIAATQIYDHLNFDVLLRSPDYFHFCDPRDFPRSYFYLVESMPGVKSVKPLHVTLATWRIPETAREHSGELRGIVAMGMDPSGEDSSSEYRVFDLEEVNANIGLLANPHNLLVDTRTKGSDYGAINGRCFGEEDIDQRVEVEIWDKEFRIVGCYTLGAGLAANGSVLMSSEGFGRFFPTDTVHRVNYGLVCLDETVDPSDFCRRFQQRLSLAKASGSDNGEGIGPVQALTRDTVRWRERYRWWFHTPIGAIFLAGVVVALVVGGVVVYMVLSNDVANHIHEYATLKAMGYGNKYLSGVVMQQAILMAVLGYLVAWTCAEILYRAVGYYANLPMEMNWFIRLLVLVLSIGMCCVSGFATLRKLRKADPAELF